MKHKLLLLFLPLFTGCAELQDIADSLPQEGTVVTDSEISSGLRQALMFGIDKQVSQLTQENGFFNNELVRITLPPELQKVDRSLRDLGMEELADEGLIILNRAAEEAVKQATPIFVDAVRQMSFADARNILMGGDHAATDYLIEKTRQKLYNEFTPVVNQSLEEVGATEIWSGIITRYNAIPLTADVNPDLVDYVTREALEGVFTMIALEERTIRNKLEARTTELLRSVFSLQD